MAKTVQFLMDDRRNISFTTDSWTGAVGRDIKNNVVMEFETVNGDTVIIDGSKVHAARIEYVEDDE